MSITLATSLNCYACNRNACKTKTYTKMDCIVKTGNPIVDSLKAALNPQCIKIEGIDSAGNPFQERNCTDNLGPSTCTLITNTISMVEKAKNVQCHICDTNYCNSGTQLFATISLVISSILFFF
ncbi:hypothetical protein RN001_013358 [Aquatica leii]|uniref:Protein sleepless n=1 Tax=Aquatica leii TaxID=1421715 RepID=A0AAN7P2Q5_9COLE|nr:hypothetical protein RN001_013358 [Aquatica leii]